MGNRERATKGKERKEERGENERKGVRWTTNRVRQKGEGDGRESHK